MSHAAAATAAITRTGAATEDGGTYGARVAGCRGSRDVARGRRARDGGVTLTQVARTQVTRTQVTLTQVTLTQVARTQVALTQVARTQVALTQVTLTQVARTQVARTRVALTRVARGQVARTQVARGQERGGPTLSLLTSVGVRTRRSPRRCPLVIWASSRSMLAAATASKSGLMVVSGGI